MISSASTACSPASIRGFTLIEILVALAFAAIIAAGIARALERYGDGLLNKAAAGHATTVKTAARQYIAGNYAALVAAAGPTSPATVTPAMLTAYLPTGFSPVNAYGQSFIVQVIEPTAGALDAIVLTTGGDTIDGQSLRRISQLIGVDGGYVPTAGLNADAEGTFGGWKRALGPFGGSTGPGTLAVALFVTEATSHDDYLHRASTAGQPQFNRMNTAIDMAGNDLDAADAIDAATLNLPEGNSLRIGNSYFYGDATNSALRQTGGLRIQTPSGASAPISQVGNITSLGSVAATGDITANTTARGAAVVSGENYTNGWFRSQGNGGWYSTLYGGGWHMSDPTWIRAYNGKNIYTTGQFHGGTVQGVDAVTADQSITAAQSVTSGLDISAGRNVSASAHVAAAAHVTAGVNVSAAGRVTAGEYLLPQGVGSCNTACPENGLIARTVSGAMVSCSAGLWIGYSCGGVAPPPTPGFWTCFSQSEVGNRCRFPANSVACPSVGTNHPNPEYGGEYAYSPVENQLLCPASGTCDAIRALCRDPL